MSFGNEMRKLRLRYHMSVRELAVLLSVDAEKLKGWERKDTDPPIEEMERVLSILKYKID